MPFCHKLPILTVNLPYFRSIYFREINTKRKINLTIVNQTSITPLVFLHTGFGDNQTSDFSAKLIYCTPYKYIALDTVHTYTTVYFKLFVRHFLL